VVDPHRKPGAPRYLVSVAQPCLAKARALSSVSLPSSATNLLGELLAGATVGSLARANDGEYFYDHTRQLLYYVSSAGPPTDVVLPVVDGPLVIGTSPLATQISWSNVTFEHTTWLGPNRPSGFLDDQAGVFSLNASSPSNNTLPTDCTAPGGDGVECAACCMHTVRTQL
jgi:hypothetical protein